MQGYYFETDNPYRDWSNAFAEGQEKAREGDLNAAVLLLEAAILQDPHDSEVTFKGAFQPKSSRNFKALELYFKNSYGPLFSMFPYNHLVDDA